MFSARAGAHLISRYGAAAWLDDTATGSGSTVTLVAVPQDEPSQGRTGPPLQLHARE